MELSFEEWAFGPNHLDMYTFQKLMAWNSHERHRELIVLSSDDTFMMILPILHKFYEAECLKLQYQKCQLNKKALFKSDCACREQPCTEIHKNQDERKEIIDDFEQLLTIMKRMSDRAEDK